MGRIAVVFGLAALGWVALASAARAETIDFEGLESTGDYYAFQATPHDEDGFRISTTGEFAFALAQTGNTDSYSGSTALFNNTDAGVTTLGLLGGGAFRIESIDLSEVFGSDVGPTTVTFVGTFLDSSTITQTFSLDEVFGFETFSFGLSWSNLLSVSWTQTEYYHQFDNIRVDPVPEPATALLLVAGLAGLGARRLRRGPRRA